LELIKQGVQKARFVQDKEHLLYTLYLTETKLIYSVTIQNYHGKEKKNACVNWS